MNIHEDSSFTFIKLNFNVKGSFYIIVFEKLNSNLSNVRLNFLIDLTNSHKGKLYRDNTLVFYGDGYKAITMMIRYHHIMSGLMNIL